MGERKIKINIRGRTKKMDEGGAERREEEILKEGEDEG